ncbi:MAG: glycerol-3-phosphate 1-O-acyltransferase PlsY [Negativicutes bacterium]|nr:glycerol-3-phosphate 1-O-acyltransferase PlsY [Negativicutes bacterium]
MITVAVFVFGYVVGSIPSGLIVGRKFYDVDLRQHGSKNIGASNAFRTLGPRAAAVVFVSDVFKGVISVLAARMLLPGQPLAELAAGVAAISGHNWSLFLRFSGGKGVATGLGVILMLSWQATLVCLALWAVVIAATRYASLASMLAAVCAPAAMWWFGKPGEFVVFACLVAAFIIIRHRTNIVRLLNGTELRIKPGNARSVRK